MDPSELRTHVLDLLQGSGVASRIKISGCSMESLLQAGDEIEFEHSTEGLRFGDLIVFQGEAGMVAHRVIRVYREGDALCVREKGDNTRYSTRIPVDSIQGKIVRIYKGGRPIRLQSPLWSVMGRVMGLCSVLEFGMTTCRHRALFLPFCRGFDLVQRVVLWLARSRRR